jgi:hypothetical protein
MQTGAQAKAPRKACDEGKALGNPKAAHCHGTLDSLVRLPHWTKVPRGRCNSPQDIPCYFHGAGYCFAHHFCTAWESEPNAGGQHER